MRLLQANLLTNALDPAADLEHEEWRTELSEDYRTPTLKITRLEALSNRLRRIYLALFTLLVFAWLFRITAFVSAEGWLVTASIANVPGWVTVSVLGTFYLCAVVVVAFWPRDREAMGEFREGEPGEWKGER